MPSGNVTAVVIGGTLFVTGDDAGNQLWIGGVGKHTAGIIPLDNTTINGVAGPAVIGGIQNGYVAALGGGDDVLVVSGDVAHGALLVDMGDGNDQFVGAFLNVKNPLRFQAGPATTRSP